MATDRLLPRRAEASDMSADMIAGRRFGLTWRGYDPEEVKGFLAQVAAQVKSLKERCEQAEAARREAEQRASHPQLDEATLVTAVGDETAAILRTARTAAGEITAKAQATAEAALEEARVRAAEVLAEAESLLAARTAEAEAAAAEVRENAENEVVSLRRAAEEEASGLRADAARRSEETVEEAQSVRGRILADLARRRKVAAVQIEQLRAGRERLLDAYLVVRRTLDEVTEELQRADSEARAASEAVGRQHENEGGSALELRPEDVWPALASAEPKEPADAKTAGGKPGGTPATGETPGVLTPKVAHEAAALRPAVPPPAPGSPMASTPASQVVPVQAGPAPGEKTGPNRGRHGGDEGPPAAQIVARSDSIESVRILREDSSGAAQGAAAAPSPAPADVRSLFARIRAGQEGAIGVPRAAGEPPSPAEASGRPGEDALPEDDLAEGAPGPGVPEEVDMRERVVAAGTPTGAPEPPHEIFGRRDELTNRLESSLARKLKRALQDEQNSILDRLRNLKGPATPATVLPAAEEQPDRFVEAGRPLLEEAARAGSQLMTDLYAASASGAPPVPQLEPEIVEDLAEELGRAIAEPLRQRLELAFGSGSEDAGELAEALGAAYREWKTQRIESAARDQVAAAFSRGAYLALPEGATLRWVASGDEGPCPDCDDNALAGGQRKGQSWPTGQLYPPAHPGCRCVLGMTVPVAGAATVGSPRASSEALSP